MSRQITILFGLCLTFTGVWMSEENNIVNQTLDNAQELASSAAAASAIEEVKLSEDTIVSQQSINQEEPNDSDIDRSSYFHQHYHDGQYHHHHHGPTFQGFWKKKFVWRPRWVKTWQEKKIYVAVWKRMWGPATINEWVPIPRPPPGWIKPAVGGLAIKTHPY